MTKEQIKNDYAVSKGYDDWKLMLIEVCLFSYEEFITHENELMEIYTRECLKLANKKLSLEECGFDGMDYGIVNENNIIK